jgi:predicted amidohydrolase
MRIALAQLAGVEGDIGHNLATARRALDEAARLKADCVVLPELHLTGFVAPDHLPHVAEPWPGQTLAGLIELAASRRMGLCTSFVEAAEDGSVANTAVLAGPDGRILSTYRKTHLFDAERRLYTPGDELTDPADFLGAATGLLVCYDVEFPEAARRLALAGAQCILVPSANMAPWGPRHRVFVTARALENHLFVAYCNRCGEGPGMTYCGGSVIIDPMGEVLCEAGADEAVVCAEIDMGVATESTKVFDYRLERRPDLYGQLGS